MHEYTSRSKQKKKQNRNPCQHLLVLTKLPINVIKTPCLNFFSPADNNWYRAVVLEVGENELSVIYADYGNGEKVPFSRILPIPLNLLQLPFQITRCTLTGEAESVFSLKLLQTSPQMLFLIALFLLLHKLLGKEHFPAEMPEEVQQMFQSLLLNGVLATVQSYNGSDNVLSLTLPTEHGGGHLTNMILDALQAQAKSNPRPSTTQKADQTDSNTSAANTTAAPERLQPRSIPETPKGLENTTAKAPEPTLRTLQQKKNGTAWCDFLYYCNINPTKYPSKPIMCFILPQFMVCIILLCFKCFIGFKILERRAASNDYFHLFNLLFTD